MASATTIKVSTPDSLGVPIEVPACVGRMSVTIKNMLEDFGDAAAADVPVPLHNVTAPVLAKIAEFCVHYDALPPPLPETDEAKKKKREEEEKKKPRALTPWEKDYVAIDHGALFELLMATNYLDIKPLFDLVCRSIALMIQGKTPEEIRVVFNIKNDFTPEEEEKVRKDNEWA